MSTTLTKGGFGVHRLTKLTKGIDLSRPRHEIVIIGLGLATFWTGVALKVFI